MPEAARVGNLKHLQGGHRTWPEAVPEIQEAACRNVTDAEPGLDDLFSVNLVTPSTVRSPAAGAAKDRSVHVLKT